MTGEVDNHIWLALPWNAINSSAKAAFNMRSYSGVLRSYNKEQIIALLLTKCTASLADQSQAASQRGSHSPHWRVGSGGWPWMLSSSAGALLAGLPPPC